MSILHTIAEASTREVEAAGLRFRIRKVSSADLMAAGHAGFALLETSNGETPEKAVNKAAPGDVKRVYELQAAVVAAGVRAIFDPNEGQWIDVRVVTGKAKPDPDKGVIHVDQLPAGAEIGLYQEIMTLCTDDGGWAELLASFRQGPSNGAARGSDRDAAGEVGA